MSRGNYCLLVGLSLALSVACNLQGALAQQEDASPAEAVPLHWHSDYSTAWQQAKAEEKMLFILFQAPQPKPERLALDEKIASDADVRRQLQSYVLLKVPTGATIQVDGEPVSLLEHPSMKEMHGRPGLAIIDLAHPQQPYFGHVVSCFPFMRGKFYRFRADYLPVILDLPKGTITQRTMIWAVRVHPERPASTKGENHVILASEARSHSQHQAKIGVQGHHRWETRFHRIRRLLGGRFAPIEVVAESWPSQTMIDSCIDCVASWRQSSGHWNAVKSPQTIYGYDIKRGGNGIWYGTGIFAN